MAHHVRVRKIAAVSKKDGHVLKGKYLYRVECKRSGCGHLGDETSEARAQITREGHYAQNRLEYMVENPNDKAHQRTIRNKAKKAGKRGNS